MKFYEAVPHMIKGKKFKTESFPGYIYYFDFYKQKFVAGDNLIDVEKYLLNEKMEFELIEEEWHNFDWAIKMLSQRIMIQDEKGRCIYMNDNYDFCIVDSNEIVYPSDLTVMRFRLLKLSSSIQKKNL